MRDGDGFAFFDQGVQTGGNRRPRCGHRAAGGAGRIARIDRCHQFVGHRGQGIEDAGRDGSRDSERRAADGDGVLHVGAHRQAGEADTLPADTARRHIGQAGFGNWLQPLRSHADGGGQRIGPTNDIGQRDEVATGGGRQAGAGPAKRCGKLCRQRRLGAAARYHGHRTGHAGDGKGVARTGFSGQTADVNRAFGRRLAGDQCGRRCQVRYATLELDGNNVGSSASNERCRVSCIGVNRIFKRRGHQRHGGQRYCIRRNRDRRSAADADAVTGAANPVPAAGIDRGRTGR